MTILILFAIMELVIILWMAAKLLEKSSKVDTVAAVNSLDNFITNVNIFGLDIKAVFLRNEIRLLLKEVLSKKRPPRWLITRLESLEKSAQNIVDELKTK